MNIQIDLAAATPVYEQIVRQIEQAVLSKEMLPGTALPSIRQLANDLELNPNTVAKAYQMLERNQIILTAGRKGTFIHKQAEKHTSEGLENSLRKKLNGFLEEALEQGLSAEEVKEIFNEELRLASQGRV